MKSTNLEFCFWISGFVDGIGCFSISVRYRKRNKIGIEITPSFSIAQKVSKGHLQLLIEIRNFFKTGSIRGDKSCYKYETRNLKNIIKTIIPFFIKYPLKTDKKKDFSIFADICSRMEKKKHISQKGLIEILELLRSMNISGNKRYSLDEVLLFLTKN